MTPLPDLEVPSAGLFDFDRLEERPEVADPEAARTVALDGPHSHTAAKSDTLFSGLISHKAN
jgi:hypothetical protein